MTQSIINVAQMVEIEHNQGEILLVFMGMQNFSLELLLKILTVRKLRKRVEPCLKANGMDGTT
ncbi:hypothetical protein CWE21_03455 [Pseudidiomarina aquimaris]|uniref:Uncharacterized protein n=1 Tax=Pseudidiomarina aquimaris TaxID=641841 RepID=A0A432XNB0_9GAMM|nr:hypothetical protein [Pseudidiomarina aquimaris]RUO50190.1 hypothetical protein CWE21_03455 [Pseudidiomarina aquimaris]